MTRKGSSAVSSLPIREFGECGTSDGIVRRLGIELAGVEIRIRQGGQIRGAVRLEPFGETLDQLAGIIDQPVWWPHWIGECRQQSSGSKCAREAGDHSDGAASDDARWSTRYDSAVKQNQRTDGSRQGRVIRSRQSEAVKP